MRIIPARDEIPEMALVEGDEIVCVRWKDEQGRRCTTFLTANQIAKMIASDDVRHVMPPEEINPDCTCDDLSYGRICPLHRSWNV